MENKLPITRSVYFCRDGPPSLSQANLLSPNHAFHGWELQNKGSLSTLQRETRCFPWVETSKWQFSQTAEPPAKKKKKKSKFQGTRTCGSVFWPPNTSSYTSVSLCEQDINCLCRSLAGSSTHQPWLAYNPSTRALSWLWQWWAVNSTACVHFPGWENASADPAELTGLKLLFSSSNRVVLHCPKSKKRLLCENRQRVE